MDGFCVEGPPRSDQRSEVWKHTQRPRGGLWNVSAWWCWLGLFNVHGCCSYMYIYIGSYRFLGWSFFVATRTTTGGRERIVISWRVRNIIRLQCDSCKWNTPGSFCSPWASSAVVLLLERTESTYVVISVYKYIYVRRSQASLLYIYISSGTYIYFSYIAFASLLLKSKWKNPRNDRIPKVCIRLFYKCERCESFISTCNLFASEEVAWCRVYRAGNQANPHIKGDCVADGLLWKV